MQGVRHCERCRYGKRKQPPDLVNKSMVPIVEEFIFVPGCTPKEDHMRTVVSVVTQTVKEKLGLFKTIANGELERTPQVATTEGKRRAQAWTQINPLLAFPRARVVCHRLHSEALGCQHSAAPI
eukprot:3046160-Amphidinium_carterae.1